MWGDIIHNDKPVTRRTLVGYRAHECMYSWVYLTDFLSVRRLKEQIELKEISFKSIIKDFDTGFWKNNSREKIDPHFQVKKDNFYIAYLISLLNELSENELSITEFGSTFFTLIDKLDLISPNNNIKWEGIDNSDFVNETARYLHPTKNLKITKDWENYKSTSNALLTSRFVCSYAIDNSNDFADFISKHFTVGVIEDAFSSNNKDQTTYNHGQKQTFYSLDNLFKKLNDFGFEVFILDSYPDCPAGSTRCHNTKFFFYKPDSIKVDLNYLFNKLEDVQFANIGYKYSGDSPSHFLNKRITDEEWVDVERNKRINPVWSRTDVVKKTTKEKLKDFVRPIYNKLLISKNGLGKTDLRGANLDNSIIDYIHNEKNK